MPPQPNFLIIGAAKSATTSLADYLNQHPDIFLPPYNKEPNYFAFAGEALPPPGPASPDVLTALWYSLCITNYPEYLKLFEPARNEGAIGEASVRYLYFPEAPRRIKEKLPDVRLIAILREPVSRLYSHYCMNVQYQLEPLGLADAIVAESTRREAKWGWDWHYVNVGLYAQQLKRYFEFFPRDQIKIFLYDEFLEKPAAVFQEMCRYLGVDDQFVPDMSNRSKVAYRPKNLALDQWLHWPRSGRTGIGRVVPRRLPKGMLAWLERWNSAPVPKLDPGLRRDLSRLFYEDVRELEELLGRKIPWYA
jgi:hypothetical protein